MTKRFKRAPTQRELDLFEEVVADVFPLDPLSESSTRGEKTLSKKHVRHKFFLSREIKIEKKKSSKRFPNAIPIAINKYELGKVPGLDRKTALRLKKGKIEIDCRLDLHGMSQIVAREALERCIITARKNKYRCILIITGKGLKSSTSRYASSYSELGILRRIVPSWLSEPPLSPHILAYAPAQPEHGGSGALYVRLRRPI